MPSCRLGREHLVAPFPGLASNSPSCLQTAQVYQSAWAPKSQKSPSRPPLDSHTGRGGRKEDRSLWRPRTKRFRETEGSGPPWQGTSSLECHSQMPTSQASFSCWMFQPGPRDSSEWEKGKMPDPSHEVQTMPPRTGIPAKPKGKTTSDQVRTVQGHSKSTRCCCQK